ncbi:unnamed protein product [Protopolystoma xenopodis]|uniref:Uncharacterized protein n=1 Tax=Protopolystoma xenopodis TaxID=117903 RepID=A0A448WTB4_9PLAT|nr:unnamed protein product [Protopolystoma xenopodis]
MHVDGSLERDDFSLGFFARPETLQSDLLPADRDGNHGGGLSPHLISGPVYWRPRPLSEYSKWARIPPSGRLDPASLLTELGDTLSPTKLRNLSLEEVEAHIEQMQLFAEVNLNFAAFVDNPL